MKKRIGWRLAAIFALGLLLCTGGAKTNVMAAKGDVEINKTNFPDAKFRAYLTKLEKKKAKAEGSVFTADGTFKAEEIRHITTISVKEKQIEDLTGIQVFTALTKLVCDGNDLTSLDVSGNTSLVKLKCINNALTSLDVSKNNLLEYLNCSGNVYTIVAENGKFDLSDLPGKFNVKKASNWKGGSVNNGILTLDKGSEEVSYTYDCGNERSKKFTLEVETPSSVKPKGTSISKITAGKKKLTMKWKKQTKRTTGYQIQYSLKKNFADKKTVTVKKNDTTSQTIKNLKAKKKYYVRIRTYRTVNGEKYYSSWSEVKTATTKK